MTAREWCHFRLSQRGHGLFSLSSTFEESRRKKKQLKISSIFFFSLCDCQATMCTVPPRWEKESQVQRWLTRFHSHLSSLEAEIRGLGWLYQAPGRPRKAGEMQGGGAISVCAAREWGWGTGSLTPVDPQIHRCSTLLCKWHMHVKKQGKPKLHVF